MKQGWRWFGVSDAVSLREIRQAGVTDVVAALYSRRPGEVWPVREIRAVQKTVAAAGMRWSVVESVPVHEDVKKRTGEWRRYIANYRRTLENLAKCGIRTVCVNFMPALDWTRTNLNFALPDGSEVELYDEAEVAAFDLFVLKRPGAEKSYSTSIRNRAQKLWAAATPAVRRRIAKCILYGLPGTVDDLTPAQLLAALRSYDGISETQLRANMYAFLNEITPTLEAGNMRLAIHPDDPPHPVFGLPRIFSTAADIREMCRQCPSPLVGLTLCTGSLGGDPKCDEAAVFREFHDRVHFCHFRNIVHLAPGVFRESESHLFGKVDIPALMSELLREEKLRGEEIVVRPDHGRLMQIDRHRKCFPGYSYGGRLVGLAELRGLEAGLKARSNHEGKRR
ncbi:MAG: mannonate dehydratase [Kiritimatiellae bacterium]|nr:mannonate dehydratase [Kiritimatiellia bacterium]